MKRATLLAMLPMLAAAGECIGVSGNWIRAADLREAVPELEIVPPETPLWRAPVLGATRQLRKTDWDMLGRQFSTVFTPQSLCLVQRVRQVQAAEWAAALSQVISGLNPAARAKITAVSHTHLPEGRIELPPTGLSRVRGTGYLLRGRLIQASGYQVPVWVKFECAAWRDTLVAKRDLKTGESIAPTDISVETRPGWLDQPASLPPSSAVRRIVRRPIREGSEVLPSDLVSPLLVQAGQPARVSVLGNGTILELQAIATQAGRLGERILMENPANRRRFPAVVTGPRAVSVSAGLKGDT